MKRKFITLLLLGTLLTGCSQNNMEQETVEIENAEVTTVSETKETEVEEEEPYLVSFEANTIEGDALTSECFSQARVTMLNVWATYCNPCLNEMPDLGEIASSYDKEEFQVIGIISDVVEGAAEEEIKNAKELIAQTSANYPHLLLNESLYTNVVGGIQSVPTTIFVNQRGEVLGYVIGAQSKENWEGIINDLLAKCDL